MVSDATKRWFRTIGFSWCCRLERRPQVEVERGGRQCGCDARPDLVVFCGVSGSCEASDTTLITDATLSATIVHPRQEEAALETQSPSRQWQPTSACSADASVAQRVGAMGGNKSKANAANRPKMMARVDICIR